jgi:CBS domain-containing protein
MGDKQLEVDSPIRTCVTLDGKGEGAATQRVFCKRVNETVRVSRCVECPYAVSWPATLSDPQAALRCRTSTLPPPLTADTGEKAIRTTVGEVMQPKIVCVREDADMDMLGRLLAEDGLDAVPVVDANGHPKGIVCKTDLLRALRDKDELTAEDVMTPFVHALHEGAPLSFALAMLALEDIEQVPIVSKDGVVVGMLASRDAIRWMARSLGYAVPETRPRRES